MNANYRLLVTIIVRGSTSAATLLSTKVFAKVFRGSIKTNTWLSQNTCKKFDVLASQPLTKTQTRNVMHSRRRIVEKLSQKVSGASPKRPKLEKLLRSLDAGDVLTVWRFYRFGRSLPHLLDVVANLKARDIAFQSLNETIDNLLFHKSKMVRDAINVAGVRLWFLPPYSPDLNPIEQTLAKIKH